MSSPPVPAAASAADGAPSSYRSTHLSYLEWQRSVPALYDLCMSYGLTWPSLSAQWLPTEPITHKPSGCVTHQMLIGTYTQPGFPNFIQLAQVTLPDKRLADPMDQFLRHPLARDVQAATSTAASAAAAAASSSAAAAPAASGLTGSALDDLAAEYRPDCSYYRRGALKLVHKVRASQELHRIRPFVPSFSSRNLGASSITESARDAEGRREGTASSAQRCLAAAKGPESHVKIYDVCSGAQQAAAASAEATSNGFISPAAPGDDAAQRKQRRMAVITASMGSKERDSALLTLTGHVTGGWALDWNTVGANAQAGLLVSGDDEGGICVWSLEDAQTSLCAPLSSPPPSSSLQLKSSHNGAGAAASSSAVPAAPASPMQRLQKQQPPPRTSPHFPASSAPVARSASASAHSAVPTLAPRAQWSSAHDAAVINDISWLRTGCAHTFLSVSDDRSMQRWDCRAAGAAAAPTSSTIVHASEVTSVSPCPFSEHWVLTAGGADRLVKLWDLRSLRPMEPLHEFKAHGNEVSQVTWAPFASSERGRSIFASSGKDRRIMLWDASLMGSSLPVWDLLESGPPELIFSHAGHTGDLIEDFSWHPSVPWLLASVGSENVLQVWEPFEALRTPTSDDDGNSEEQQALREFTEMLLANNPAATPDAALGGAMDASALLAFVEQSPALQSHAIAASVAQDLATHPSVAPVMQFVAGGYERALNQKLESMDRDDFRALQQTAAMDTASAADSDAEGDEAASPRKRNARKKRAGAGRRGASRQQMEDSSGGDENSSSSRASSPPPALRSPVAAPPPQQTSARGRTLKKPVMLIVEQSQQAAAQQKQPPTPSGAAAPAAASSSSTAVVHASIKLADVVLAKQARAKLQNGSAGHSNSNGASAAAAPFSALPSNWQTLLRNVQRKLPASGATELQRSAFDKALAALLAEIPEQPTVAAAASASAAAAVSRPAARSAPAAAARVPKKPTADAASSSSTSSDEPSSDDDEPLITPSPLRKRARPAAIPVAPAAASSARSPTRKNAAAAASSPSPAVVSPARKAVATAAAAAAPTSGTRARAPPTAFRFVAPRFYISRVTDESIFLRDKLTDARKKLESKLSYENPADRRARLLAAAALRKPKPTPKPLAPVAPAVAAAAAAASSRSPQSLVALGLIDEDADADESKEPGGGGCDRESVASSVKSEPGLLSPPAASAAAPAATADPEPLVKLEPITTTDGGMVSGVILSLKPFRLRADRAAAAPAATPAPAAAAAATATPMQLG